MKLNLEVELDWIDDEMNIDDTIKQNVINSVVGKIQKNVEDKVEKEIENIIGKTIISKINKRTDGLFNEFLTREVTLSDSYGSKIKCYPNVEAIIKERFDQFMIEQVDKNGKTSTSSYDSKTPRVVYIIDEQLKKFSDKFTTDAVKQVSEEIKKHVAEGLTQKLGTELMKVLKVNEMLELPSKK